MTGEGKPPVGPGVQERGPRDGFELADLAGQDAGLDPQVAGGVLEAGVPAGGQEPADPLFCQSPGEGMPDNWRKGGRAAEAA